jgi:hypothetical protein
MEFIVEMDQDLSSQGQPDESCHLYYIHELFVRRIIQELPLLGGTLVGRQISAAAHARTQHVHGPHEPYYHIISEDEDGRAAVGYRIGRTCPYI